LTLARRLLPQHFPCQPTRNNEKNFLKKNDFFLAFGLLSSKLLSMKTIILNGKEIQTGAALESVRFDCVFGTGLLPRSFKQGVKLDEKGNIRCKHCSQLIHETNVSEILAQL
jgi:hypothetical protein